MDYNLREQIEKILKMKHDFFYKETQLTSENAWHLEEMMDGYTIYTRKNPDNELSMTRANTVMPYSIDDIITILSDPQQKHNYDLNIESAEMIQKIDDDTMIVHIKAKPPLYVIMLMSGRDIVIVMRTYHQEDKSVLFIATSINYDKIPPTKDYERADLHISSWHLTPMGNGQTSVILMTCVDPKGNVPTVTINQAAKNQAEPLRTLKELIGSKLGKKP